jgi:alanine dehydrogenase
MLLLSEELTRQALPFDTLILALERMFQNGCEMPVRHHHQMEVPNEPAATMLLMPAWLPGQYAGVKIVNVMPGNSTRGLPAISAQYLLSDATTGEMLALIDGGELTARRTAAASALAARFLAREDAEHLLIIGTGRLSLNLIEAHRSVRKLKHITVWGRDKAKATAVCHEAKKIFSGEQEHLTIDVADDLDDAVSRADIISTCTLSNDPLVKGACLKAGAHVDLVGAFLPTMRESDNAVMARGRIFVDTRAGCLKEAGDIVHVVQNGTIDEGAIQADLFELCRGEQGGRSSADEITVFKSVGAALEDLAGAMLAVKHMPQ